MRRRRRVSPTPDAENKASLTGKATLVAKIMAERMPAQSHHAPTRNRASRYRHRRRYQIAFGGLAILSSREAPSAMIFGAGRGMSSFAPGLRAWRRPKSKRMLSVNISLGKDKSSNASIISSHPAQQGLASAGCRNLSWAADDSRERYFRA